MIMWWKIVIAIVAVVVIAFVLVVAKMAITEAKEETRDIERGGNSEC